MPENVAVFGATSAIAQELCQVYARRNARLFLVARNAAKLAELTDALGPAAVGCRVQDFDDTEQAEASVEAAIDALGSIDVAVIAHGLLGDQLESERSFAVAEQIVRTNYLSVVSLLIPLANRLEAQGSGRIVVLSTVAAERGRPRNYTYASAKSALNVYLQGVRSRLYPSGVTVHTIKLGPVDTPMTATHRKNALFASASGVAAQIARAVDRGASEAFVPGFWRPVMFAVRNLPEAVFQRVGALSGR